jgi:hypothetical protein
MEFPICDGTVSTGVGGEVLCSGSWLGSTTGPVLTLAELSTTDIAALVAAGFVTMALAYGFKILRKSMGF